jgi:hypothetical protein
VRRPGRVAASAASPKAVQGLPIRGKQARPRPAVALPVRRSWRDSAGSARLLFRVRSPMGPVLHMKDNGRESLPWACPEASRRVAWPRLGMVRPRALSRP